MSQPAALLLLLLFLLLLLLLAPAVPPSAAPSGGQVPGRSLVRCPPGPLPAQTHRPVLPRTRGPALSGGPAPLPPRHPARRRSRRGVSAARSPWAARCVGPAPGRPRAGLAPCRPGGRPPGPCPGRRRPGG